MKKVLFFFSLTLLLCACSKQKESLVIEPTIENFVNYIAFDYEYGEAGEFIEKYLDNTFSTNLFLINLLKDSYDSISIETCDETGALLRCDDDLVRMDMTINDGKIQRINLREGRDE